MAVPFMRAYTQLLVKTCHRRGAHAMGGMSAFIPNRREPEVTANALGQGHRGQGARGDATASTAPGLPIRTWCRWRWASSTRLWASNPIRNTANATTYRSTRRQLLDFAIPGGQVTEAGLAANVSVGVRYIDSWLHGIGAAAIDNLMEDAATAEISRSQVWQWVSEGRFDAGRVDGRDRCPARRTRKRRPTCSSRWPSATSSWSS